MVTERNPIETMNGLDFREHDMVITKGAGGAYCLQVMSKDGSGFVLVAQCASPDKLGRWALNAGAKQVRHSYDCTTQGDDERAAGQ